jgi:thymidylate kinase
MLVIILSGPSGAGKTTVLRSLASEFTTQPERYMELNTHKLDNKYVLSKWTYIGTWFDSVLTHRSQGMTVLLTDRSPIDTAAYAPGAERHILPAVLESFEELLYYGVQCKTILVTAAFDILMQRIDARLQKDCHRRAYHEDSIEFCRRAYAFYERHFDLWDVVVDTSESKQVQGVQDVRTVIQSWID